MFGFQLVSVKQLEELQAATHDAVREVAKLAASKAAAEALAFERGAQVVQLQNQLNDLIDSRRELEKELLETIRAVRAVNFPFVLDAGDVADPPTVAEADRIAARRHNNAVRPPAQPAEGT